MCAGCPSSWNVYPFILSVSFCVTRIERWLAASPCDSTGAGMNSLSGLSPLHQGGSSGSSSREFPHGYTFHPRCEEFPSPLSVDEHTAFETYWRQHWQPWPDIVISNRGQTWSVAGLSSVSQMDREFAQYGANLVSRLNYDGRPALRCVLIFLYRAFKKAGYASATTNSSSMSALEQDDTPLLCSLYSHPQMPKYLRSPVERYIYATPCQRRRDLWSSPSRLYSQSFQCSPRCESVPMVSFRRLGSSPSCSTHLFKLAHLSDRAGGLFKADED